MTYRKKLAALAVIASIAGTAFAQASVYFSPKGGAEEAVVQEVGKAKKEIHVMTYQLTNKKISEAIIGAWLRGVHVKVIVDRSQRRPGLEGEQYCCAYKIASIIPVLVDAKHPIQHNKVIVIDGETVITGSFNFSNAAEKANAENLLVLRDSGLASQYIANWDVHAEHSEKY